MLEDSEPLPLLEPVASFDEPLVLGDGAFLDAGVERFVAEVLRLADFARFPSDWVLDVLFFVPVVLALLPARLVVFLAPLADVPALARLALVFLGELLRVDVLALDVLPEAVLDDDDFDVDDLVVPDFVLLPVADAALVLDCVPLVAALARAVVDWRVEDDAALLRVLPWGERLRFRAVLRPVVALLALALSAAGAAASGALSPVLSAAERTLASAGSSV